MSEQDSINTDNGFEAIAAKMIEKYPEGHITEKKLVGLAGLVSVRRCAVWIHRWPFLQALITN
jgi:hypothetical protein